MTRSPYLEGLSTPDLGFGASFALWGFRACARGKAQCPVIVRGFRQMFEDEGLCVLTALLGLARVLGVEGRRSLTLASPGSARVTADELSIVAALAATMAQDAEKLDAHFAWLMAGAPHGRAMMAADHISYHFTARGLEIREPQLEVSPMIAATPNAGLVVYAGGRA